MDNTIVLEGWLTKSPEKRLWKSKWNRRWFVLKQSGDIPGQHLLEYYADNAYKKFKGRIDLDECEQVDAGLSLKFESGARSNKHVFDLKTSKRVYYLATKSEEEMNKWVSCICSVCGLKMREEEPENGRSGNRYSPQPSADTSPINSAQLLASSSNTRGAHVNSSINRINNNNSLDPVAALNYSVPRSSSQRDRSLNGVTKYQREPKSPSEGSGPYIPISECHTGKPGSATTGTVKENRPSNQNQSHPTPPPAVVGANSSSKSNLSIPISSKASKSNSHVLLADEFYDVPRSQATVSSVSSVTESCDVKDRPALNWDTFPKEDKNRASSRSCSASFDAKANSSLSNRAAVASTGGLALGQRTRCESGPGDGEASGVVSKINKNNPSIRRSATPTTDYMNSADIPDFAADFSATVKIPPPRPPKPATLSRSKISDHQSSTPSLTTDCYDIPKPAAEKSTSHVKINYEKQRRVSAPHANNNNNNNVQDHKSSVDILDKTVEKPVFSGVEKKTIDSYDIPVSSKVHISDGDILDATVAVHPSSRTESGKHLYKNSAPGFKATKDSVFIYDYRPSLPTTTDDQIVNFHSPGDPAVNDASQLVAERSPRTPNSGFSEVTPPAVDRNLKPRRKGSDSDTTASPTTPNPFLLKPAPDGKRVSGSRETRGSNAGPGSASTLPSVRSKSFTKNNGHSQQQVELLDGIHNRPPGRIAPQIVHSRDASTSEDDAQKNRSTDELKNKSQPTRKPRPVPEGSELQYLDLDLDSDNSSPRTPSLILADNHQTSASNLKESQVHVTPTSAMTSASSLPSGSPSASKSTVYKTVDFVKTDALNTLRSKVEEGHRNPQ